MALTEPFTSTIGLIETQKAEHQLRFSHSCCFRTCTAVAAFFFSPSPNSFTRIRISTRGKPSHHKEKEDQGSDEPTPRFVLFIILFVFFNDPF